MKIETKTVGFTEDQHKMIDELLLDRINSDSDLFYIFYVEFDDNVSQDSLYKYLNSLSDRLKKGGDNYIILPRYKNKSNPIDIRVEEIKIKKG